MPTTEEYLEDLVNQKNTLAANLVTMGVDADESETLNSLAPKVLSIAAGGTGIESIEQTTTSIEDSGENIITATLTNGTQSTFTIKNGSKGSTGYAPIKGTDYWTNEDKAEIIAEAKAELSQIELPTFVSSVDEMTDTSKQYVLDGSIYAYMYQNTSGTVTEKVNTTYTDGYRLSVTDGSAKALEGATVTDFIDISHVNAPLTINLSGIQWADSSQNQACAIVGYNADKVLARKSYLITPYQGTTGITVSGETTNVTVELGEEWISSCQYIRICGSGLGANASIIMSYEGTTEGYSWVNTGVSYTATIYTDLIGIVDENNVIRLSANNLPSGTYTLKYGDDSYETIGTITVE